ncbi:hypothetical protein PIB30_032440 [Stylosanthes scabra]|uniref:Uncharacterized protein n=1 Tax=Stylosanthes scabra TaxID=79078 RepID=A0ABU6QBR3_9FABA|nr:hypothetical protein [Stylosanthes scabra]
MAENPQGDQETAEAVWIPRELSSIYRWVTNDVLGTPSALDQQYIDELKLTVCFLNLDHPTFPNRLCVNEVMFTEFGVQVPFTDFQQRLLNRASVAPLELHPNAWSSIRCFELVTEERRLKADQRDTADILIHLFSKNNLAPKFLLGNSEEARRVILEMAGNDVTLARLHNLLRPPPARVVPTTLGPSSAGRAVSPPIIHATETRVVLEGGVLVKSAVLQIS